MSYLRFVHRTKIGVGAVSHEEGGSHRSQGGLDERARDFWPPAPPHGYDVHRATLRTMLPAGSADVRYASAVSTIRDPVTTDAVTFPV